MTAMMDRTLPQRHPGTATGLASALEHARILRAAGDAPGAARILDDAFAAEGVRAPAVSERLRFRALVQRADLALVLHEPPPQPACADVDSLRQLVEGLAALDGGGSATR